MEKRHSELGVLSFVSSILGLVCVGLIFICSIGAEIIYGKNLSEDSPVYILIGLIYFFNLFLEVIGIGMGIAGLFQKGKKYLFAILGVIISVYSFYGLIILLTIGLLLE